MTATIFKNDKRTKVYKERSVLSSRGDNGMRLDRLPKVASYLARNAPRLSVVRPLVESQRVTELLSFFPNARVLWIYRNHRDVIASNLAKFGRDNGIRDLQPLLNDDQQNWRAEGTTSETAAIVRDMHRRHPDPVSAAALFWFLRNSLFFAQRLHRHSRVKLVNYEQLAANPNEVARRVYAFIGWSFPGTHVSAHVNSASVGRGQQALPAPEVDRLCSKLTSRLDRHYDAGLDGRPGAYDHTFHGAVAATA